MTGKIEFDPLESFDFPDEETVVLFPFDGEWEGVTPAGERIPLNNP